jgi:hypothetical protein
MYSLGNLLAAVVFGLGLNGFAAQGGAERAPIVPGKTRSHPDGRAPIGDLFRSYHRLRERGWQFDTVASSRPPAVDHALPIIALRSPRAGPALWLLAGIHGEEPAGPNAIAAAIDDIAALGAEFPVVLIPLCNPHGYARNWRYLNAPVYSETIVGLSVGDSAHLLPDPANPGRARSKAASNQEADALTRYILKHMPAYPARYSIDLHEDNLIDEGYVYSQGVLGGDDPLAIEAVRVLRANGIPLKMSGRTRFNEVIKGGIVGRVIDSSIDELMSAGEIIANGRVKSGPGAKTVLVFETPAAAMTLARRKAAHLALIQRIAALIRARPR